MDELNPTAAEYDYQALVWVSASASPSSVTIRAGNLGDARRKLEARFGYCEIRQLHRAGTSIREVTPDAIERWVVALSVALFVLSLILPVFPRSPGWLVLVMGWMEVAALEQVSPFIAFGWFANPFLALAWLLGWQRNGRGVLVSGGIALVTGVGCLFSSQILISESGSTEAIHWGPGFYAWLGSQLVIVAAAVMGLARRTG